MCLLTYFPADVMPNAQYLRNGMETNNDGHGYAIVCDGDLIVGRSMDFEEMLAEFVALRAEFPHGDAMFHSRYGTCGTYTVDNVHPFEVNGSPLTVLAHNGHIHEAAPKPGDSRVDSRIMAEDILPRRFPVLDSPRTQRRLHNFIGSYNKLVILTVDPRYAKNAYIINAKAGTWVDGAWYSNSGYLPSLGKWWEGRSAASSGWDDYDDAPISYRRQWVKSDDGQWSEEWVSTKSSRKSYRRWWQEIEEDAPAQGGTWSRSGTEGYVPTAITAMAHGAGDACGFCESLSVDRELGYCRACCTCQDCGLGIASCYCTAGESQWEPGDSPVTVACPQCGSEQDCGCLLLCVTCGRLECMASMGVDDACSFLCEGCAKWPCECADAQLSRADVARALDALSKFTDHGRLCICDTCMAEF